MSTLFPLASDNEDESAHALARVRDAEAKVVATWRLLLRCMWHCFQTWQRSSRQSAATEGGYASFTKRLPAHAVAHPATRSRSIYRQVMDRRRGSSDDASVGTHTNPTADNNPLFKSASFVVLHSSVPMMFALVFVRRIRWLALVMRQKWSLSERHLRKTLLQRHFCVWRRSARETKRWKRWVLRRCIDHWWRFVQKRLSIKYILLRARQRIGLRAEATRRVSLGIASRCFMHWQRRAQQRFTVSQLASRCARYVDAKTLTHPEYVVRLELKEDSGRDVNGHHSLGSPSSPKMLRYCFLRWKKRTEGRLEMQCADMQHTRVVLSRCFSRWMSEWSRCNTSSIEAEMCNDVVTEPPPIIIHTALPPIALAYQLRGYTQHRIINRKRRVLQKWRLLTLTRLADRYYGLRLLYRLLECWICRTSEKRVQRATQQRVLYAWHSQWLRRQQQCDAETHFVWKTQTAIFNKWRLAAQLRVAEKRICGWKALDALHVWRDKTNVKRFQRVYDANRLSTIFFQWYSRTLRADQRRTQELVAEALRQHVTILSCFRKWRLRSSDVGYDRRRMQVALDAVDELRNNRIRNRVFGYWRRRWSKRQPAQAVALTTTTF